MATYKATHPVTGKTIAVQGDTVPSEMEWDEIFAATGGQPVKEPTTMQKIGGMAEVGANLISGAIAEPVAGILGSGGAAFGGLYRAMGDEQAGNKLIDESAQMVKGVQDAMTYQPRTETGQEYMQGLGKTLAPVGEAINKVTQGTGDFVYDLTGSPAAGALATAAPIAVAEAIGAKVGSVATKAKAAANVNRAISEAAPSTEQLRQASRAIYNTLDESGAAIKPEAFDTLAAKINKTAKDMGHNVRVTGKIQGVLDALDEAKGKPNSLSEIETLRKVASNAGNSIDNKAEQAMSAAIVDDIDAFFDSMKAADLAGEAVDSSKVGPMYRQARDLWGRSRRSEMITDAVERAKFAASGEENGIRNEIRNILKSKKKSRMFSDVERKEMQRIADGTPGANIAKFIGKFGPNMKSAAGVLGTSAGIFGGQAAGAAVGAGGLGAIAVPLIGSVSQAIAERMTKGNARFADDVIRAGKDSRKIAEAYIKHTPKAQQSAQELTELFIAKKVPAGELQKLEKSKVKAISDAAIFAAPVISNMEEKQNQESVPTIDVKTGFGDKQVEPMQDPQTQLLQQAKQVERQERFAQSMQNVEKKASDMASAYKVEPSRKLAIDMQTIATQPKYVGMALLNDLYDGDPAQMKIAENFITVAMTKPQYRPALQAVKNVLRNANVIPPDNKQDSINSMIAMGVKPEKAAIIANTIRPLKPQEAKKVAESIRAKLTPDMYNDFAPLISSIEALA